MTHLSKCITSGCLFSKVKRSLSLYNLAIALSLILATTLSRTVT
ncbi:hypothetical protein [Trichocoleus desertorum]